MLFPAEAAPFSFPQQRVTGPFLHILTTPVSLFFEHGHPHGRETMPVGLVVVSICLSPVGGDVDSLFLLCFGHLYIFFGQMSVRIPCLVLTGEFCVVVVIVCASRGMGFQASGASTPPSR